MKIRKIFLHVLALICVLMAEPVFAVKRALLIEIGRYPTKRQALNTERDAYWMKGALRQQRFLTPRILQDKDATAANIRKAFSELIRQCKVNDKVVIHYGGHGTQLDDEDGGDEMIDQKDEALVPYDAPLENAPGDRRFIRDDELGKYIDSLRIAVGTEGHVLILIDACHSGTMTRGQAATRTDNIRSTESVPASSEAKPQSGWFDLPASALRAATANSLGNVVMISGTEADKPLREILDDERLPVGPLSICFSKAMLLMDERASYQSLFNQIQKMMSLRDPKQNPVMEGNKTAKLLGGDIVLPDLFTWIKTGMDQAYQQFRFPKGMFLGFTRGSEVTVNLTGQNNNAGTPVTGRVVEATPFESVIELSRPLPKTDSVLLKTTLVKQSFEAGSARITLTGFESDARRREIESQLSDVPNLRLVEKDADWLIRPFKKQIELCRAADGLQLELFEAGDLSNLGDRITAYAQADWLRDLDVRNPSMRATMSIIPVKINPDNDNVEARLPVELRQGIPVLRTNQYALFTVRNTGSVPFYFSVIDILPDAGIDVGLPNNKYPPTTLRLKPGEERSIPVRIAPPIGLETYKLILSKNPASLNTTIQTRGLSPETGAQSNPISNLLSARLRGSNNQALKLDEAGTDELQFWVETAKQ